MGSNMHESPEDISIRIQKFMTLDSTVCKMLSVSCMVMRDEEGAIELLKRIRSHVKLGEDRIKLFDIEFFLEYIKDLLDILNGFSANPLTDDFKASIQDTYEVFLYNKDSLRYILYDSFNEHRLDKRRENYWLN